MSTFSYPGSPSLSVSPRIPQEQKWTVSPEFSDALLAAMRERTESGGPIPRLPSLLQLPGSDTITSPVTVSEVSLDNTKLTMKTRVAVRDKTPHRFQVVPLREIRSFAFPSQDSIQLSKATRGAPCTAKLNTQGTNKTHTPNVNDNSVPTANQIQEQKHAFASEQHERGQTLGDVNKILPDLKNPCIAIQPTSPIMPSLPEEQRIPARRTPLPPVLEKVQPQLITTHRSTMPTRSILRSRNVKDHDYSHVKSPSLGNLHEKPPLSREHNFATLPRVGCRKRTNTLSVDGSTLLRGDLVIYEETKILERRCPLEHNALKRHAIYTQSLFVPHDERRSSPGRIPLKIESKRLPFLDAGGDALVTVFSLHPEHFIRITIINLVDIFAGWPFLELPELASYFDSNPTFDTISIVFRLSAYREKAGQ
ncbi:hypothetical protein BDZ94DRAFT_1297972 [Collybia nuda]|uniref:Uncharacterized protein n=1 Tax=Collybia nuda TaxID=64659 RepID=A0A9P5Y8N9_9AGAR|nr:hypothetical protein BDZ94DRAFT_1297972 [Collybia nuda]